MKNGDHQAEGEDLPCSLMNYCDDQWESNRIPAMLHGHLGSPAVQYGSVFFFWFFVVGNCNAMKVHTEIT